jgi:6,7-dimethyl-8-ribityllumazine synthase
VQLDTGTPVGFGLVTTDNIDQADARSQDPNSGGLNVGTNAARAALELALQS